MLKVYNYFRFFIFVGIFGVLLLGNYQTVKSEIVLFEKDLYFGIKNDPEVTRLQQFLTEQSFYNGPVTGNFFSLTLNAVKKFQENSGISPVKGYFGSKSREVANRILSVAQTRDARLEAEEKLAALNSQLKQLQKELSDLLEKQKAQIFVSTSTVVSQATTTPPVLPNPFDSTLKIEMTYPSRTLSSYINVILTEFQLSASEKIAVTRIAFKNSSTLSDLNLIELRLVNSSDNSVLVTVDSPKDTIIEFKLTADSAKADKGLMVSGGTYHVLANIITPNTLLKPKIRLDIESASDVSAFDFNDLSRKANISKNNIFPIEGPIITTF